jgi:hypothetical protein
MYNPGDLIWLNSGVAAVASSYTWSSNLAGTQPGFRILFLGVCMDQKLATDTSTNSILVCLRGFFAFPCVALGGALHIGSWVGPAKDAGGNFLTPQILANVATYNLSIGTLAEEAITGQTLLEVYLQSWLVYTSNSVAT